MGAGLQRAVAAGRARVTSREFSLMRSHQEFIHEDFEGVSILVTEADTDEEAWLMMKAFLKFLQGTSPDCIRVAGKIRKMSAKTKARMLAERK